jgi:hypothetical protein
MLGPKCLVRFETVKSAIGALAMTLSSVMLEWARGKHIRAYRRDRAFLKQL